jgi:hypothetical protein
MVVRMYSIKPLARGRLREAWDQNRTPIIRLLLWEIHRLRALTLRANDLVCARCYRMARIAPDSTTRALLSGLRKRLVTTPTIAHWTRARG